MKLVFEIMVFSDVIFWRLWRLLLSGLWQRVWRLKRFAPLL